MPTDDARNVPSSASATRESEGEQRTHRGLDHDNAIKRLQNLLKSFRPGYTGPNPIVDLNIPTHILDKIQETHLKILFPKDSTLERFESLQVDIDSKKCSIDQAGNYIVYNVKFVGNVKPEHITDFAKKRHAYSVYVCNVTTACPIVARTLQHMKTHFNARHPQHHLPDDKEVF
ncbi:hypothetical protein BDN70DRAFT_897584 [Pholiota conissans]|uniref:Uncharacterized protein n=1 Tax=Pholiota conissans TaxID=109636 RepID=A0A9P5YVF5_9AGAR|nr:hypothetical protein BDN70DRAFT_897584 [Pholiota conissans]